MVKFSDILDPEFAKDLNLAGGVFADNQGNADDDKWSIADRVNGMWEEHKTLFPSRIHYLSECSRVLNKGRKRKYLSDSGETLRRWCDIQATYATLAKTVKGGRELIDLFTQDHLYRARKLYLNGKVESPFDALKWCLPDGGVMASADEMYDHFEPRKPSEEKPQEVALSWLRKLPVKFNWDVAKKERFEKWLIAGKEFFSVPKISEGDK